MPQRKGKEVIRTKQEVTRENRLARFFRETTSQRKGKEVTRTKQEVTRENRLARFFRETMAELRKVVWPTRAQAINLTGIVVAAVVAMSVFLFVVDYVLTQLIKLILER